MTHSLAGKCPVTVIVFSAIIMGIIGVSVIRENPNLLFSVRSDTGNIAENIKKWKDAVRKGREKEALLYAASIVPDDTPELPDLDYIRFFTGKGLGTLPLTAPFGHFDYIRWRNAYKMQQIVEAYSDRPDMELLNAVMKKRSPKATAQSMSLNNMFYGNSINAPPVSLGQLWDGGYTSLNEFFRLFSAVAYQKGYEPQIIAFYDETQKPLYAVCELRKNGKSLIAAPINGRIWENCSVDALAANPSPVKDVWPGAVTASLNRRLYRLPAEVMDFRLCNQRLRKKLIEAGFHNMPLFGEDPRTRIEHYIQKYAKKVEKSRFSYWNFPFFSLMSSAEFPEKWKLNPEEKQKENKKESQ